jgi:hypothetical protein
MGDIVNVPSIKEDKIDLARMMIEHRATWMALMYEEMEKAGADAEKITRAAVRRCGNIHGMGIKSRCSDPKDVTVFNKVFLFEDGKKNFEIDVVEADKQHLKAEFHYCALVAAWQKLGLSREKIELFCDIAMDGDRGIAEAMGLKFDLGDTISHGCATCKLHFHK